MVIFVFKHASVLELHQTSEPIFSVEVIFINPSLAYSTLEVAIKNRLSKKQTKGFQQIDEQLSSCYNSQMGT